MDAPTMDKSTPMRRSTISRWLMADNRISAMQEFHAA